MELGEVPALASETVADQLGVQAGDVYYLRQNGIEIPVIIVGIWAPLDTTAPYWGIGTRKLASCNRPVMPAPSAEQYRMNSAMQCGISSQMVRNLHSGDVACLDQRIQVIQKQADSLLPGTKLVSSPLDALNRYQKNAPALTYLLYAFSVPILGLILAFIGLVTGLFVGQQRGEMAILRGRGASSLQVVGISMLQGILLAIVALAGGILLGYWIAHAIGQSRSFMDFTASGGLEFSLTISALAYGLAGIGIILLAQVLIPTLGGAGEHDRYLQAGACPAITFALGGSATGSISCCSSRRDTVYGSCNNRAAWHLRARRIFPAPCKSFAFNHPCHWYFCSSPFHASVSAAFDEFTELGIA